MLPIGSAHPKMLDPIVDETFRIFEILQNKDGSWGTEENKLDRGFVTSWVIKSIWDRKELRFKKRGIEFFKGIFDDIGYDVGDQFQKIGREKYIKGVLNCADILYSSNITSNNNLNMFFATLLRELHSKNWLSSISVASYVVIGLSKFSIWKKFTQSAEDYIRNELPFQERNLSLITPDICIALPDLLIEYINRKDEFFNNINSLTDIKLGHVLIGLASVNDSKNKVIISKLRTYCLERLRKRQFTEVDKKLTKGLLDLTLLLKSGHGGVSLSHKLHDYAPTIHVESEDSETVILRIDIDKLENDFGYLNLNTLASYVYAMKLLKEEYVHILNSEQYSLVKPFFVNETIPITVRRETSFELIVLFLLGFGLFGFAYFLGIVIEFLASRLNLSLLKGYGWETALLLVSIFSSMIFWRLGLIDSFPILRQILMKRLGEDN